jgi:hypothetical protein
VFDRAEQNWIISALLPNVSIRFKQLFAGVRKSSTGPFPLIDTLDNATDLLWFTQRYPLTVSTSDIRYLKKRSKQHTTLVEKTESILSPNYQATERGGLKAGQSLRWYQLTALDFIESVNSVLLIDDVGLGKSYEGLGIGLLPKKLPLVIVCQPHLQEQWAQKAAEFIDLSVHCLKGNTPYELPSADIYIVKYSQLSPWVDVLSSGWIKAIAFDEIQELRTGTESNKGHAARIICEAVETRVGLTATLIYNYGIEAFNIVNIIRPGLLGTKDEFSREWCGHAGVVKNPDALGAYLRETQMILRRTKKDVGQEAKQKRPHVEWVAHSEKDVKDIEQLAEQLAIQALSSDRDSRHAAGQFSLRMRMMTGIAKAKAVAAYVRMFVETGTPILLFGWHHEVYDIWAKELSDLNPLFYTGRQSTAQKEKNKHAFIRGESNILVMSLRSGAGTDGLQHRASTCIYGEFDWSPKVHTQCTGRLDRDGQVDEVFAFYVATQYGSDPAILDVLGLKESQSHGIIDPGEDAIIHEIDVDKIKNLALAYLASRGVAPPVKREEEPSVEQMALAI